MTYIGYKVKLQQAIAKRQRKKEILDAIIAIFAIILLALLSSLATYTGYY